MENYIINNKTLAIFKKNNKTIIYDVDKIRVINKSIQKILELNCNFYGNDINFLKKQSRNLLNIKYKVPIIINKNVTLIQINSLRCNNCLFLNYYKILDYYYEDNILKIKCLNQTFNIYISKNSLEKNLLNAMKLNNIIKYKKTINFV